MCHELAQCETSESLLREHRPNFARFSRSLAYFMSRAGAQMG
jgi:hypothetical protein